MRELHNNQPPLTEGWLEAPHAQKLKSSRRSQSRARILRELMLHDPAGVGGD